MASQNSFRRAGAAAAVVGLAVAGPRGPGAGPGAGAAQDRHHRRILRRLCRSQPRRGRGRADGDRRFRRQGARPPDRAPVGRPSDQARRRRPDRAQMVRRRRRQHDHRHRHLVGGAGRAQDRPGKGQDRHQHRRGLGRPHRPGLLGDRRALGLRHLCARQGDRRRHRQGRRRLLVLPHRRLRLRPCARARRHRRGDGVGRQGAGRRPPSAQHAGLLVLPAAGPGLEGQDHRSRQCRPGHDQLDQAGRRVRHRQGRPASGRPPGLLDRREFADPAGGAGPGADRGVLLGP